MRHAPEKSGIKGRTGRRDHELELKNNKAGEISKCGNVNRKIRIPEDPRTNQLNGTSIQSSNSRSPNQPRIKSCRKRLKEFQKNNRHSLLEHDKKIRKITSKLQSVKSRLKEGKSKFLESERKSEGESEAICTIQSDDCTTQLESTGKENALPSGITLKKRMGNPMKNSLKEGPNSTQPDAINNQAITTVEFFKISTHSDAENGDHINQLSFQNYACNLCEKLFDSSAALNIHNVHDCPLNIESHGCPACSEYFCSSELLLDHLRTHDSQSDGDALTSVSVESSALERCEGNDSKPGCNESFRHHLNIVHPEGAAYRCDECGRGFGSSVGLRTHKARMGHQCPQVVVRPHTYDCCKCGYITSIGANYRHHSKICDQKTWKCAHCEQSFVNDTARRKHQRVQHPHLYLSHRCDVCLKGFTRSDTRRIHEKLHLRPDKFRCSQCNYFFHKEVELRQHSNICSSLPSTEPLSADHFLTGRKILNENLAQPTNTSLKDLNCPQFTSSIKKKASRIPTSSATDLPSLKAKRPEFTCKTCQKTFISNCNLRRHEKSHARTILTTNKKYDCKLCKNVSFSKWNEFESHVKTHPESRGSSNALSKVKKGRSTLKKCRCLLCDKEFAVEDTMFSHFMYTHAWRKPHMCNKCQKSFCTLDGLKRHSKAHMIFDDDQSDCDN
ncbi:unnamed protein product [Allacma fusca]|uniref:C2H2-type domain-containing protein n=1 Tax=Allacma fusca TaxID=39272 RepID=A0A8J2KHF2_9HEXA|nr:unnamed protein product [Allacma fusca]